MSDSRSDSVDQQSEIQKMRAELRDERKKHRDEISKLKDELEEKSKIIDDERRKHRNEINKLKDELDKKDKKIDDLKQKLKKYKKNTEESPDNERGINQLNINLQQLKELNSIESKLTESRIFEEKPQFNSNPYSYDVFYPPESSESYHSGSSYYCNTRSKSYHDTHPNPPGIPSTAYALTAEPQRIPPNTLSGARPKKDSKAKPSYQSTDSKAKPSYQSTGSFLDAFMPTRIENSMTDSKAKPSYQSTGYDHQQRRPRITYDSSQKNILESAFQSNPYMVGEQKKQMAERLNIREDQIQSWFSRRRAKEK